MTPTAQTSKAPVVNKTKKGSPVKTKKLASSPALAATTTSKKVEVAEPKKVEQKRKSRHQYDRITHQVFTPLFMGLEAHLVEKLTGSKVTSEDVHQAILSYDVKSYFTKTFENKGRRSGKKSKNTGTRLLTDFMIFQAETRANVSARLEKDLGRKPTQPEVVIKLGELWQKLKEKPDGTEKYKQMYEKNKREAEAAAKNLVRDSDDE